MKRMIVMLSVTMLIASVANAGTVRTLTGQWVAAKDDSVYLLQFEVPSPDPTTGIEDLTGTLRVRSVGSDEASPASIPVTGQYLSRTGIVALNIGEAGGRREYGIGDTWDQTRKGFRLRIFRVRTAQGINFEQELFFEYKRPSSPEPTPPGNGAKEVVD